MAIRKTVRARKSNEVNKFLRLVESITNDSTEGFDEFADDDELDMDGAEGADDADFEGEDDLDLDAEEGTEDEVTITLPREQAQAFLDALQAALDGGSLEDDDLLDDEGDDLEGDDEFGDEDADVDAEGDDDMSFEDEDEEETEEEEVEEDEEVTLPGDGPSRKTGTPAYKNSHTVNGTILKPGSLGKAEPATLSGEGPSRKAGTPAYKNSHTVSGTKLTTGKHLFEID